MTSTGSAALAGPGLPGADSKRTRIEISSGMAQLRTE
jgi:hypothetical protein